MKWVAWVVKLSITVVIVSMLTVATTGYVVNWYVQSLLGSYNIPLEVQSLSLGSMMKGMLGFGEKGIANKNAGSKSANSEGVDSKSTNSKGSDIGSENAKANADDRDGQANENINENADENLNENGAANDNGSGSEGSNGGGTSHPNHDEMNTGEGIPEDAFPVMGGMSGQSQQSQQSQQQDSLDSSQDQVVVITPDDLLAKKDELPDQQKEEIFNILMAKLPEEDMRKMTEAMEDGLTESEMIEIQQILSKHLDKEQYSKVMDMLKK